LVLDPVQVYLGLRDLLGLRDPWVSRVFLGLRVLKDKWGRLAL
jgi:hypothetical protein